MNDFTKGELQDILAVLEEWGRDKLYSKVQDIIDNYCEHYVDYPVSIRCEKCNKDLLP